MPTTGRSDAPVWTVRRVRASWSSVGLVLATVVAVLVARAIFVAASQPIGWAVAALTVAVVISPLIELADRVMPRAIAIILTFVFGLSLIASVGVASVMEAQNQLNELSEQLPAAAGEIEASQGPDGMFAQVGLESLVQDLVDQMTERVSPTPTVEDAVGTVPAFFVSGVLAIFFLVWGPSMFDGLARQITDPERQRLFTEWVTAAVVATQRYIMGTVAMAVVVGTIGGGLAWWADLPTPMVLGVVLGAASLVPYVGVLFGAAPMLLLAAGFEDVATTAALFVALVGLQAAATFALRRLVEHRSLRVGPAVIVVAALIGSDAYGIGGALVATVAAIVVVALIDQADRSEARLPEPASA